MTQRRRGHFVADLLRALSFGVVLLAMRTASAADYPPPAEGDFTLKDL